ncbi:DUF4267 domain-containing protein [Microvirga soli]|uniref:DUF4267 domain-containing protein n=1 Tax=Microvirga soli TaxID=1854496 RepID=UPI00191DDB26|nr:DUF4267 domain-containing protein [Microvirga soli]
MMQSTGSRGLPKSEPSTWLVWALGLVFIGLGFLFLGAPGIGTLLFGLPAPEWTHIGYLFAIGLRDLAFGLYLLILSFTANRRILAWIFAATVVIPVGDVLIVFISRGLSAPAHLLLHGASAAVMAGASLWLFKQSSHDNTGGFS